MTVVTLTDRPKSVRYRCVIEVFVGVFFCVVTLLFGFFCGCRGFFIGLSQISSFFSLQWETHTKIVYWINSYPNFILALLSRRLKWTIVTTSCPSSVRHPSVIRLSLIFHIFDFFSESTERNLPKLDRKHELSVIYQVCVFRAYRNNKMATLVSDWLRHFRLLLWNHGKEFNWLAETFWLLALNHWTELAETWQEARIRRPLSSFCFTVISEKQASSPCLSFSTSFLKPLSGICRNLTSIKISTSSTKFVFYGSIGQTRWPPRPLISWDIFDLFSQTAEQNMLKLDRK